MSCTQNFMRIGLLGALLATGTLSGAVRSSANYTMETDTIDGGGVLMGSPSYSADATVGGGTAQGSPSSLNTDLHSGMVAQLYEFVSLTVTSQFLNVEETQTNQLFATATTGDGSTLQSLHPVTSWSIVTGPIASIGPTGLATTDIVLNDSPAFASGTWLGLSDTVSFGVLDTNKDNYSSYGYDGLPDLWQVSYFGMPPNSDAGPSENPDHDPDPNIDEWMTGHDPTDPADFFRFFITGRSGTTATFQVDRTMMLRRYTLQYTTDCTSSPAGWTTVTTETPGNQTDYTFEDTASDDDRDFYRMVVDLAP